MGLWMGWFGDLWYENKTNFRYDTGIRFLINVSGSLFLGIKIKLNPEVLLLLSPICRSLSLQMQLGPIEVIVGMSMTQLWFGINT